MRKPKYQLTFIHKLLIGILLVLGMAGIMNVRPYRSTIVEGTIPFLQEGSYLLEITYEGSPANNEIIAYSDKLAGEDNAAGVVLAKKEIEESAGVVHVPLELTQGVYGIKIGTLFDNEQHTCVKNAKVQSVRLENTDGYALALLCFLTAAFILFLGLFVPVEKYGNVAVVIGFGFAASLPLFSDFLFGEDDLRFHLARIEGIYQALRTGEFPVRINPVQTSGYGSLSATMYPQLFLYPFALLRFGRVSLMLSYKLLLLAVNIGSGMAAFYAVKNICKSEKIGFAACILYVFAPYRLNTLYFRGALGEALAMVFFPLVIWGIYEVLWGERKKWPILMLGMTCVLQSHLISTELCLFFLIIEVMFRLFRHPLKGCGKRILSGVKAAVGTLILNASFLVPFLFFSGQNLQSFHMPNEVPESAVYFSQMFATYMMPGGSSLERGTTQGEMPLTVGGILAAGAVLFCIVAAAEKQKKRELQFGRHCLVYGLLSLFLASWIFPWKKAVEISVVDKLSTPLQFAWRFLGPATIFLCIVSAIGFVYFAEIGNRRWIYGIAAAVIFCSTAYFYDMRSYETPQVSNHMEVEGYNVSDSMYMYSDGGEFKAFHLDYKMEESYVKTARGTRAEYSGYRKTGSRIKLHINPEASKRTEEDYLLFPLYYFPGYEVTVNGEREEVFSFEKLVACQLPDREAEIEVSYKGLPAFRVADFVSLSACLGLFIWWFYHLTKTMGQKNKKELPLHI